MAFILDDYKQKLIQKIGYEESFAQDVAIMADSLIDYYGEEYTTLVCDALLTCKICIAPENRTVSVLDNIKGILEKEGLLNKFDEKDLEGRDHGFFTSPEIIYSDGTFKVINVSKIIILPSYFNADNPASLGILARKCIELIKSELNNYTIDGNILTIKSGILTRKETLTSTKNGIKRKCTEEIGKCLKKGFNAYEQLCLIRTSYDSSYDIHGEDYERILGGFLMDYLKLKDAIRKAEILHDDSELKEILATNFKESYTEFLKKTDKLTTLEEQRKQCNINSSEDAFKALRNLDSYFSTDLACTLRTYNQEFIQEDSIGSKVA